MSAAKQQAAAAAAVEQAHLVTVGIDIDVRRLRGNAAGLEAVLALAAAVFEKLADDMPAGGQRNETYANRNRLLHAGDLVEGLFYTADSIEGHLDQLPDAAAVHVVRAANEASR